MSGRHSGTFQYWKPSRKLTYQQWEVVAWRIALGLALGSLVVAAMFTAILMIQGDRI
jgi:hypothetical protein